MSDQKQPWPDLTEKCLATEPEAVGELLTCTDERLAELIREVRDAPDGNYPDEIRRKDACLSALSELQRFRVSPALPDAVRMTPFDPVCLSMLYTAIDQAPPTLRGAVRRAYDYISGGGRPAPASTAEVEALEELLYATGPDGDASSALAARVKARAVLAASLKGK